MKIHAIIYLILGTSISIAALLGWAGVDFVWGPAPTADRRDGYMFLWAFIIGVILIGGGILEVMKYRYLECG